MKTPLRNTRTHLSFLKLSKKKNEEVLPLQLFPWSGRFAMIAYMGGILFFFWIEVTTVLSCPFLLACGVSDLALEKSGLLYFFPGSNLGMKSFLGKEGRDLAAAENGEVWWLCQAILRPATCLIRAGCVVVACWYQTLPPPALEVRQQLGAEHSLVHSIRPDPWGGMIGAKPSPARDTRLFYDTVVFS